MKAVCAFNKQMSPLRGVPNVKIFRHEPVQYMALCQFDNVYWDFDKKRNYAPSLIFEGSVERLDAIETKFPGDIDTVYFTENKPDVRYRYNMDEGQLAVLAQRGFWSEEGVNIPGVFTTAKFQLEANVIVDEIMNEKESRDVPIYNIEIVDAYDNSFDANAYDLASKITRAKSDESKLIERSMVIDNEADVTAEVEAAKAAMVEQARAAEQEGYKPLTPEELQLRKSSANVGERVNAIRDSQKSKRDADNARVAAERAEAEARERAEQEALDNVSDGTDEATGESIVANAESDVRNLTGGVEVNKYDTNDAIFEAPDEDASEELPDVVAAFMKNLGGTDDEKGESSDKRDENRSGNSDSGTMSGAQGLGVYTFEDQDAAQFEMREDEGKGNEKSGKEEEDESDDELKADGSDSTPAAASTDALRYNAGIDNTVAYTHKADEKSDRSR